MQRVVRGESERLHLRGWRVRRRVGAEFCRVLRPALEHVACRGADAARALRRRSRRAQRPHLCGRRTRRLADRILGTVLCTAIIALVTSTHSTHYGLCMLQNLMD